MTLNRFAFIYLPDTRRTNAGMKYDDPLKGFTGSYRIVALRCFFTLVEVKHYCFIICYILFYNFESRKWFTTPFPLPRLYPAFTFLNTSDNDITNKNGDRRSPERFYECC